MKPITPVAKTAAILSWIIAVILVLLPFHAFLTVWVASIFGHYTLFRLWKEALLVIVLPGVIYLLAANTALLRRLYSLWLVRMIVVYMGLMLVTGLIALARHTVNVKALAYGELLDLRFLGFFLMVLVIACHSQILSLKWRKLILIPAAVVVIFGLVQYWLLPYDFLKHFGYGPNTISPYETINNNIHHIRIASTLRGANPLGAYLLLIISVITAMITMAKKRPLKKYILMAGALLAMVLSSSRSAWIGGAMSILIILWSTLRTPRLRRQVLIIASSIVLAGAIVALVLRNNTAFEDAILHTDNQSQALMSSNQGHAAALRSGLHDIAHQPLGAGPGTAGPASVYNNHPSRIAENYFVQIGQEAGILGAVLFVAINVLVGRLLWQKRADALSLALFASLVGISAVNLLSHAWTDDTLAYLWWGLAGVALAKTPLTTGILKHKSNKNGQAQIHAEA